MNEKLISIQLWVCMIIGTCVRVCVRACLCVRSCVHTHTQPNEGIWPQAPRSSIPDAAGSGTAVPARPVEVLRSALWPLVRPPSLAPPPAGIANDLLHDI